MKTFVDDRSCASESASESDGVAGRTFLREALDRAVEVLSLRLGRIGR